MQKVIMIEKQYDIYPHKIKTAQMRFLLLAESI